MKFRITREELKKIKTTKPIGDVVSKKFGKGYYNTVTRDYFVDYKLVHTKDLIVMLQRLTIFRGVMHELRLPTTSQSERIIYLNIIKEFTGIDFTQSGFDVIPLEAVMNMRFLDQEEDIKKRLRAELETREHVPNKKQSKILRRLKAQGKHIID
jgi:hypothetical protein